VLHDKQPPTAAGAAAAVDDDDYTSQLTSVGQLVSDRARRRPSTSTRPVRAFAFLHGLFWHRGVDGARHAVHVSTSLSVCI